jgi:hypothetical protein
MIADHAAPVRVAMVTRLAACPRAAGQPRHSGAARSAEPGIGLECARNRFRVQSRMKPAIAPE